MGIDEPDIDPTAFLEDVEMRIGEITSVEPFPEARKDVYKLEVDFGSETRQSAAGLTDLYDPDDLLGQQVVAVVNLGTVNIAGFESQCLVTGVDSAGHGPAESRTESDDGDGSVVHLQPERDVPNGTRVY
ncbi:tRNA-binding protein [Natronomonas gomsonensis]|uniref:tRNA-binding protein n=1 Tax=Natronomonas gomsonensis TaxID=1046043 RepID=UPI0015BC6E80|nr:tRNA-binding protein [Natronomonas gomsonensis]